MTIYFLYLLFYTFCNASGRMGISKAFFLCNLPYFLYQFANYPKIVFMKIHIDMDCFFVSAARIREPFLEAKPVAIGASA